MKTLLTGALLALACVAFAATPPDRRDDAPRVERCCLDDCPYRYDVRYDGRYAGENERSDRKNYRSSRYDYRRGCCGDYYVRDSRNLSRRAARPARRDVQCVWHPCHEGCRPGNCSYEHCRGYYEHICCDEAPRAAGHAGRGWRHCCQD